MSEHTTPEGRIETSIREARFREFLHASDADRQRMFDELVGEAAAKDKQIEELREALRWARWAMEVRQASDATTDGPFDENIGEALLKIEALAGVSPAQPAEDILREARLSRRGASSGGENR